MHKKNGSACSYYVNLGMNGIKVNPRSNNRAKTKNMSRNVVLESKGANNIGHLEVNVF